MDPELFLLYQSQLCTLLAVRQILCKQVAHLGQDTVTAVELRRIDAQIKRLRMKGITLDV